MMNVEECVLATLASADGRKFTPVQIQKLMFLVEERHGNQLGGPFFSFRPYDYGPFDAEVYRTLERLEADGAVDIHTNPATRFRTYHLTDVGARHGRDLLTNLGDAVAKPLADLVKHTMSMGFAELVSSIYQEFPAMKANSVFREAT